MDELPTGKQAPLQEGHTSYAESLRGDMVAKE